MIKTVTGLDHECFHISHQLSFQECAAHAVKIGWRPHTGPFEPDWNSLILEASMLSLELRDIWQLVLTIIPSEIPGELGIAQ